MLKKLAINVFILLAFSLLNATIIHIPADFPTIQEGIHASVDGDTVLVDEGTYYENLQINKEITLASYFLLDGDLSHRDETIIDGSNYDENSGPFGSCVLFRPPENGEIISPKLTGFTIQNGQGTRVRETITESDTTYISTYYMGGGLMIWHTLPEITYNYIRNNGGDSEIRAGRSRRGGGAALGNDDDVEFDEDRSEPYERTLLTRDDEIIFSDNIFENNDSETGKTFESIGFEGEIDFSYSVFDVFAYDSMDVSEYWVVKDEANTVYTSATGILGAITQDVWVSPNADGNDSSNTFGTEENPFYTIDYAMGRIYQTADNPITINLMEGIFSPSTGVEFPIIMMSNINIKGQGESMTTIDAQQTGQVFLINGCQNNILSDFTVSGGIGTYGGGISVLSSTIIISNVLIKDNEAYEGGGIRIYMGANVSLTNVKIKNNLSYHRGGGIYLRYANIIAKKVILSNNEVYCGATCDGSATSGIGGGIYIKKQNDDYSDTFFKNVTITENYAENKGGGIYMKYIIHKFTNTIIWGNSCDLGSNIDGNYYLQNASPIITYSDIEGGFTGEGNIGSEPSDDPLFNEDYTLQEGSPCIDTGEYDVWNLDSDGSTADMGYTGGSSILPNFTEYNFGEIGDIISSTDFILYNFGGSDITIESVSFSTDHFTTSTNFPLVLSSRVTGVIDINCFPLSLGFWEDQMIITSPDPFIDSLSVVLMVTGSEGNLLSGTLSGTLQSAEYRITNDISVLQGQTLIINPGTKFLFDGEYDFTISGVLKAQGTESDSIIFDNFGEDKWRGITLDQVTNETVFEYIRISGAAKDEGSGIYMIGSTPILRHVTISSNGINGDGSYASRNTGIYFEGSDAILENVFITNNFCAQNCCAFKAKDSSPTLTHVTVTKHYPPLDVRMSICFSSGSEATVTNSIFWDNGLNPYNFYNSPNVSITYSNLEDDPYDYSPYEPGTDGNINFDPLFVDPENGDYALQEDSPCIDAGTADLDGDGEEDITDYVGLAPDMGAYEYSGSAGPTDLTISYNAGWNLVGLPLLVDNTGYLDIYPDAQTNTLYSFDGIYAVDSILIVGEGYWLRFESEGSNTITGTSISELTINLSENWNLVSALDADLSIYSINDPDSIIVSNTLYGFSGTYFTTEELVPGKGYWLRAFQDGEVTITGGALSRITPKDFSLNDRANTLTVNGMDLYFGVEMSGRERLSYSLPPKPPAGAFDVRFKDDWRLVIDYGIVEVMPTTETLTFAYNIKIDAGEHMNWVLTSETGKDYILEGSGEITVPSSERFFLNRESVIPVTFALHQNFPNPFNPITTLRYDLPEDNFVMLTVYDMLGRAVVQLVNNAQEAGFKSVQWDATDSMGKPVGAGVYMYRIEAGSFIQTKKMVLLK